jgi:hypothetical protein
MKRKQELWAIRGELIALVRRIDNLIEGEDEREIPKAIDLVNMERTKAIEWILRDHGDIMRPVQIWSALVAAGRSDPKMEVQATTFDLWQRGRIAKEGRGEYRAKRDGERC